MNVKSFPSFISYLVTTTVVVEVVVVMLRLSASPCPGQQFGQQQDHTLHDITLQLQQPQQQLSLQQAISPVKMLHDIGRHRKHGRSQSQKPQMQFHREQIEQLHQDDAIVYIVEHWFIFFIENMVGNNIHQYFTQVCIASAEQELDLCGAYFSTIVIL